MATKAHIIGIGSYLPPKILTNEDLEKLVDTSDEWIVSRSGIKTRHIAEDETTSSMAIKASEIAIKDAGIDPSEINLILVATVTPDMSFPSTSCILQDALKLKSSAAFDISAGCTGFIYALHTARAMIESGIHKCILVLGVEKLTAITNWKDRTTCVLFGDGAGAVVIKGKEDEEGLISSVIASDGSLGYLLDKPAGGTAIPITHENLDSDLLFIRMKGNEVFRYAVTLMVEAALNCLKKSSYTEQDLRWVIPHQANIRIIDAIRKRMNLPQEKVFSNIHKTGNTSAASIPLALDDLYKEGNVKKGDLIELVAFGAGFTWGATLLRWTKE
ncbi:MAG: ketoacyl-ACP synthase III [Candidatus Coatesbacteria bacterium]|nr:ketoacyl-ACP synthase III [Candidatus Coatesbacteria bacterium]